MSNARDTEFYKVLEPGYFGMSFDEYIERMFYDQYNTPTALDFDYDPVQDDFTYEMLEAELKITSMSTYMDIDSHATPEDMDTAKKLSGKIVPFKKMETWGRQDVRRERLFMQNTGSLTPQMEEAIQKLVFGHYDSLLQGNRSLVAYNRDQAVSTGSFEITATNNPNSPFAGKLNFNFNVPSTNFLKAGFKNASPAKWWDYSTATDMITNLNSDADPIKDIMDLYYKATTEDRKRVGVIEISKAVWYNLWNHPKVINQVMGGLFPMAANNAGNNSGTAVEATMSLFANQMSSDKLKTYMTQRGLPPVVVTDNIYAVKQYNKKTRRMDVVNLSGFSSQYLVLRPVSNYGAIKTAAPIMGDPGGDSETIFNSRTLITKHYNVQEKRHWTESEESSLAVLTQPSSMYYLEMGVAAS
jgi:hypothetical protein